MSDVHVVLVVNHLGDANWIPISVENAAYLILDRQPKAASRLNPHKISAAHDCDKLRIGHSQRGEQWFGRHFSAELAFAETEPNSQLARRAGTDHFCFEPSFASHSHRQTRL